MVAHLTGSLARGAPLQHLEQIPRHAGERLSAHANRANVRELLDFNLEIVDVWLAWGFVFNSSKIETPADSGTVSNASIRVRTSLRVRR